MNWTLVIAVSGCCLLWAIVGWELCHVTHKQRGLEVDRPVTDALPPLPDWLNGAVPDFVPDDWAAKDDV